MRYRPTPGMNRWERLAPVMAAAGSAAALAFFLGFERLLPGVMPQSRLTPLLARALEMTRWSLILFAAWCLAVWAWSRFRPPARIGSRAAVAGILLFGALLRWSSIDSALNRMPRPDGPHFSAAAMEWVQQGEWRIRTGPYRIPARTLPGAALVMGLSQWAAPGRMGAGTAGIWISGILSLVMIRACGRRLFSPPVGDAAALLLCLSPLHIVYSRQLMSDVPWGLLVLCMTYLMLRPGAGARAWLACGALTGLGLLFKPSHATLQMAFLFCALLFAWRDRAPARAAAFLLGLAAGSVPAFAFNAHVLGHWASTPYHVYWPDWASVGEALHPRHLFGPPLAKGFFGLGNVPYYALSFFGLDPRPERMIWIPVFGLALLAAAHPAIRRGLRGTAPPAARRCFALAAASAALYGGACLLYSWQDTRFLLPIVPLALLCAAWPLHAVWRRVPQPLRRTLLLLALGGAGSAALAMPISRVRAPVVPDRVLWERLAEAAKEFDVLVTDEDPVILTYHGVWTETTVVVPFFPPGDPWYTEDPEATLRTHGAVVEPFEGAIARTRRHLEEGRRVAVWVRRPHARPEITAPFESAFSLPPFPGPGVPGLREALLADPPPGSTPEPSEP